MSTKRIIECVPNFSEGRNKTVIDKIVQAINSVDGASVIHVDPGFATNRTVVTIVGSPEAVVDAAYEGIAMGIELINMNDHSGEHPRMGATDVCPFIPISGVTMEDAVHCAKQLAERVGRELNLPCYLYENAAQSPDRTNLAVIRSGEYEGLDEKLSRAEWKPDFGPSAKHPTAGATVIGARDFLVAYNVNLNTTSVRRANAIAFDVREKGRVLKKNGVTQVDAEGNTLRKPGSCPGVKAIGWYIDEYKQAQISMNLTDLNQTSLHTAYEACYDSALSRGLRVTGSELVGLVPKKVLIDAGKFYLAKQNRSMGLPEREIIHIAVKSLGLDELGTFDPDLRVIEYQLDAQKDSRLADLTVREFMEETASESPAPGGGSVSALVAGVGVSLGTMVANLSAHKRGWDDRWEYFSDWAAIGENIRRKLVHLVDADTAAFNAIIEAFRLPKGTESEQAARASAIQAATIHAIEVPQQILHACLEMMDLLDHMVKEGNPNSITDAGVGALCARAAAHGSYMNMQINVADLKDDVLRRQFLIDGKKVLTEVQQKADAIIAILDAALPSA